MADKVCERCQTTFICQAESISACWCLNVQVDTATRTRIASEYGDCLCETCLTNCQTEGHTVKSLPETKDYYFNDQGFLVFTAAYHKRRGFCCGNGCLHCPY